MKEHTFIATCAFGVESELSYELRCLGHLEQDRRAGQVRFKGDFTDMARANLWLRTAERVFWLLADFECPDFESLYENVRSVPWGDILPADASLPVDGNSVQSTLTSVPAVQRVCKKAVVDAMIDAGHGPRLSESGAVHRIRVSILRDRATVAMDCSGKGLHKRGYRDSSHQAPLKETLAATLLRLGRWRAGRPLADPCCGSGTIAIEAAMMGRRIAPGLHRDFAAENWPFVGRPVFDPVRAEARDLATKERFPVLAADIDPAAVDLARSFARRAGVEDTIVFRTADAASFNSAMPCGVSITNPPYGERLGDRELLESLCRDFRRARERHPDWSFFFLSAFDRFERFCGRATKRRKLYNGPIRCQLYQYLAPLPPRALDGEAGTYPAAVVRPSPGPTKHRRKSTGDDMDGGLHGVGASACGSLKRSMSSASLQDADERLLARLSDLAPRLSPAEIKALRLDHDLTKSLFALRADRDDAGAARRILSGLGVAGLGDLLARLSRRTGRERRACGKDDGGDAGPRTDAVPRDTLAWLAAGTDLIERLLDRWRDGLVQGAPGYLEELSSCLPGADTAYLARLAEEASRERRDGLPPRAGRKLFRYLRSLV